MFYTFSCGEMRWSEVFLSLLKRKGFKIEIPGDWDGLDSSLLVEGKPLVDFARVAWPGDITQKDSNQMGRGHGTKNHECLSSGNLKLFYCLNLIPLPVV